MHAPSHDPFFPQRPPRYSWPLYRYTCFCAGTVLFLICLGGLVTSNEAGMSVPDWPNSYGYNMFLFPWQDWVGGIFFEHSHRLVASALGMLILGLAVWLLFQKRVWLRWLGGAAAFIVIIQGVLGGLRVIEKDARIGIFHACLAQALFILVALMALFTSRWWMEARSGLTPPKWPGRALAITVLIFGQLAVGATMRQEHAGLSIPDFPLAYGQVWPKTDPASVAAYNQQRLERNEVATTPLYINMQMAHRVGAVLITVAILAAAASVWLTPGSALVLRWWSAAWVGLVLVQIALGAFTIWTNKAADVATTHVAVGALTLVTGALLTAMSWRLEAAKKFAGKGTLVSSSTGLARASIASSLAGAPVVPEASLGTAISELTKMRLTVMVLLTTLTGFFLASRGGFDWLRLVHTLVGTALVAVCSSILNQALERKTDARMRRTEQRPFVTRRLPLTQTIVVGLILGAIGLAELALFVNGLTAILAAITLGTYVAIYTPMKRFTILNTLIGAIPGALPPLMGAVAARGHFCAEGWTLFALLAFWQLPHFYAIAWLYRDDYQAAGLRMVSVNDASGRRTGLHAVISCLLLLPVSLLPVWLGPSGIVYGVAAVALSLGFLFFAVRFARDPGRPAARALFLASITYLPFILIALVVDKALGVS